MLTTLLTLFTFDPAALLALPALWSPPGWSQYVDLIEWALDGLARMLKSGGLAVIVFTIGIKTLLLPLTVRSIQSSKAMQELQPKIKELQKKYGKDRQRVTQETMALYSQHRVNPMSGCLPMLLQIPIFFGLYQAILHLSRSQGDASEYWDGGFLWLDSLSDPDPIFILPIMAGAFQFVQTRMMRPYQQGKITDPQQQMMNTMMNFMPLTVIIFGWGFASGPVLYWATQSVYSVIQQWFITGWGAMRDWVPNLPEMPEHRRLGYRPPRDLSDVVVMSGNEGGARPAARGVLGWMQRQAEASLEQRQSARRAQAGGDGTGSETQRRADAESSAIAAERPAAATNGARRGGGSGARSGRGGARTKAGSRTNAATVAATENGATGDNGQPEPAPTSRAVIIPRKARPTEKSGVRSRESGESRQ